MTHLYNAMAGLSHRKPGVVGAAADDEHVEAEMICDGVHIHPQLFVRLSRCSVMTGSS